MGNREQAVLDLIAQPDFTLDKMTEALHANFPHYTGVYLYMLELGPYRGKATEHTRIPIGAGVCGRAARAKETVMVEDVTVDLEYIACSLETRSEIVVPILRDDVMLGEIDIDSDVPAAFSIADREFLEEVARRVESAWENIPTERLDIE